MGCFFLGVGVSCILFGLAFIPAFFSGCGIGILIGFWYSFALFVSGWIKIRIGLDYLKKKFCYTKFAVILCIVFDSIVWYYFFCLPNRKP